MLQAPKAVERSASPAQRVPRSPVRIGVLAHDERAAMEALRPRVKRLQSGQVLYEQGDLSDFVYLLFDGWAFRYRMLSDGRRQIVDFALRGALLGFGPDASMSHGVEARTACAVYVMRRVRLDELLQRVPAMAMRLIRALARSEAMAFERLMTVGRQSARERVAHLLVELTCRARRAGLEARHADLAVPLSQAHIADAIGLTPESVCRALAVLRKDGIVLLRGERLKILDIDRLIAEAGLVAGDVMPWADSGDGEMDPVFSPAVVDPYRRARRIGPSDRGGP